MSKKFWRGLDGKLLREADGLKRLYYCEQCPCVSSEEDCKRRVILAIKERQYVLGRPIWPLDDYTYATCENEAANMAIQFVDAAYDGGATSPTSHFYTANFVRTANTFCELAAIIALFRSTIYSFTNSWYSGPFHLLAGRRYYSKANNNGVGFQGDFVAECAQAEAAWAYTGSSTMCNAYLSKYRGQNVTEASAEANTTSFVVAPTVAGIAHAARIYGYFVRGNGVYNSLGYHSVNQDTYARMLTEPTGYWDRWETDYFMPGVTLAFPTPWPPDPPVAPYQSSIYSFAIGDKKCIMDWAFQYP